METPQIYNKAGVRISWTVEEIDYTFECLAKGMSAGDVAKSMIEAGMRKDCAPLTRNAIIGLWNRNKERKQEILKFSLPERDLAKAQKKIIRRPPVKKIKTKETAPDEGVSFMDLKRSMCRFIFGDPSKDSMRYCGQKIDAAKNRSYCPLHHALCYRPAGKL